MDSENTVILELKNLSKSYYSRGTIFNAVDNISLEVYKNEFLVILGPGQCGKTVLLKIIAGLEDPTTGTVEFKGEGSNRLGFVFQKTAIFPWKNVIDNVKFGSKMIGMNSKELDEKAHYLIDLVGLKGFERSYPHQLSGGMKQRVGIARSYCNNPEILLMDEPFGALDAQTRYQMQEELLRVWNTEKRTVLFVTNNIEEALFLGDRIILLSSCPATVKEFYIPNLPRPRDNISPEFLKLREEIEGNTDIVL